MEQLKQLHEATPFRPFILHLAGGREITVRSREFMSFSPSGRPIIVQQPDDSNNTIDLLLVTDIEVKNGRRRQPAHPSPQKPETRGETSHDPNTPLSH